MKWQSISCSCLILQSCAWLKEFCCSRVGSNYTNLSLIWESSARAETPIQTDQVLASPGPPYGGNHWKSYSFRLWLLWLSSSCGLGLLRQRRAEHSLVGHSWVVCWDVQSNHGRCVGGSVDTVEKATSGSLANWVMMGYDDDLWCMQHFKYV